MNTRTLQHAVMILVDPDGTPHWDHSEDARLSRTLTPAQRDTCEMLYRGYKGAKHANQMVEDCRDSTPHLDALVARKHAMWQHDADETERMMREATG